MNECSEGQQGDAVKDYLEKTGEPPGCGVMMFFGLLVIFAGAAFLLALPWMLDWYLKYMEMVFTRGE